MRALLGRQLRDTRRHRDFTDLESPHTGWMHGFAKRTPRTKIKKRLQFGSRSKEASLAGDFSGKSMQGIILPGRTIEKSRFMEESTTHLAIASLVTFFRALDKPKDAKPFRGLLP
jgi:hypothetical protein